MRCLALVALIACNLPTEDGIARDIAGATDLCKEAVLRELPGVITQIAGAALLACAGLHDDVVAAATTCRESREVISYDVLVALGCSWDGMSWDCSSAALTCRRNP